MLSDRNSLEQVSLKIKKGKITLIAGPIGILIPNALMGEITPVMAEAISLSAAHKILVPVNQGHFEIVGMENRPLVANIRDAVARILEILAGMKR